MKSEWSRTLSGSSSSVFVVTEVAVDDILGTLNRLVSDWTDSASKELAGGPVLRESSARWMRARILSETP